MEGNKPRATPALLIANGWTYDVCDFARDRLGKNSTSKKC